MEIGSSSSGVSPTVYKHQKPAEPTSPQGGNVERRQPPAEPSAPSHPAGSTTTTRGTRLNISV